MWCPECKNEYREGITRCVDCDVDLVETLPEESEEEPISEEMLNELKAAENIYDSFGDSDAESDNDDMPDNLKVSKSSVYVKSMYKYNDFKFSGFSFIGFAILGFIFIVLNVCKVIPFLTTFSIIVLTALFILFAIIGISSLIAAKRIKANIGEEETQIDTIKEWMQKAFTDDFFEALKDEEADEENQYFIYSEKMNEDVRLNFPNADTTLLDELTDELLNDYLESFKE